MAKGHVQMKRSLKALGFQTGIQVTSSMQNFLRATQAKIFLRESVFIS